MMGAVALLAGKCGFPPIPLSAVPPAKAGMGAGKCGFPPIPLSGVPPAKAGMGAGKRGFPPNTFEWRAACQSRDGSSASDWCR